MTSKGGKTNETGSPAATVNLSHSKLKRKGHTEEKYVPAAKISWKQMEVRSRKNSIGKNADALAFKEISRSLLKVEKSQKIGNGIFGSCYIALYHNEYRVVAKEMNIIESPKKTREEVWREASQLLELETSGESFFCLVFPQIGHHFIWFSSSTPRGGGGYFRNFWVGMCRWDHRTIEPLTYTRATSAEFGYPILE